MKLNFQVGNAKLDFKVNTFSLPAGKSCPFARDCRSCVKVCSGKAKIIDGKNTRFRCFAAVAEAIYPATRLARKNNFNALRKAKTVKAMVKLIQSSLNAPRKAERIHVSGDFFNQNYFDAWMEVARNNPDRCFYAYTKSIPFWVKRINSIPVNFILNASFGGKHDDLIVKYNLKSARVVFSVSEARRLKLAIDHNDSHAMKPGRSFALLIHG